MKFHWGTGIFIFLSLFIIMLGVVLYQSKQVDNTLVMDKYYEEDLKYQSKYEKIYNYSNLANKINFVYTPGGPDIRLIFPMDAAKKHTGTVSLYRANAGNEDKNFVVALQQDSVMVIPVAGLSKGKWTVKVDWAWGGKPLYTERDIVIQ